MSKSGNEWSLEEIPAEQEISGETSVEDLNSSLSPGDAAMAENEPTEVAYGQVEPERVEPRSAETDSFERLDELPFSPLNRLKDQLNESSQSEAEEFIRIKDPEKVRKE